MKNIKIRLGFETLSLAILAFLTACASVVTPIADAEPDASDASVPPDAPSTVPGQLTFETLPLPTGRLVEGRNVFFHGRLYTTAATGDVGRGTPGNVQLVKLGVMADLSVAGGLQRTVFGREYTVDGLIMHFRASRVAAERREPVAYVPPNDPRFMPHYSPNFIFRMSSPYFIGADGVEFTIEGDYHGPAGSTYSFEWTLLAGLPNWGGRMMTGRLTSWDPVIEPINIPSLLGPHLYTADGLCPSPIPMAVEGVQGVVIAHTIWGSDMSLLPQNDTCARDGHAVWSNFLNYAPGTSPPGGGFITMRLRGE